MKKILKEEQAEFIREAILSGNPWDLYDSIADAGLETEEFHGFAMIEDLAESVAKMTGYAVGILMNCKAEDGTCAL